MIELRHLCKSFNGTTILNDISVTFHTGKTNLVIGASGSGKTVLLKSIIGLHEIDSGEIFYDEREFTCLNFKEKKEIRKEIGMLFQGSALFDSSTVEENVRFPLDLFTEMTPDEKLYRANFCLQRVNIINKNHLYPTELSGGMKKRVAIARAIALNPKYLFCDEPNSGLDPQTAILIDNLISEITLEFNMTTVVNTHDMNSVMEIGDMVMFIYNGEKYWEGSKEDILKAENKELNEFVFATNLTKRIKDV
jgi:phospholipid/cholesterol/gamma-HCH transport system ATP-binding protein